MLDGEELACAPETGLDLVGDQKDPVLLGDLAKLAKEGDWGRDESALAEHRLDDDRRHALGGDGRFEKGLQRGERLLRAPAAVLVGERGLVDLRRVRSEVLLVRVDGAGEAEGEQRPAMEAAAEADDRLAAGRLAPARKSSRPAEGTTRTSRPGTRCA